MYKNAWILVFIMLLYGCGPANTQEAREEINKMGHSIQQQNWREASENISTLEDWWNFVAHKYKKEDKERFEKIIHDLDLSIASRDPQNSKELWNKLKKKWNEMNVSEKKSNKR